MFAPPAADPAGPSAPPASMFDSMPGYEGTVSGGGTVPQYKSFNNVNLTYVKTRLLGEKNIYKTPQTVYQCRNGGRAVVF